MRIKPTRAFVVSLPGILAAALLILLGMWLALLDTFFAMRGQTPTRIATILGVSAMTTGALFIVVWRKMISHDRVAIGCVIGAAIATGALTAAVGAWLITIPAIVVLASSWGLRNGSAETMHQIIDAPHRKTRRTLLDVGAEFDVLDEEEAFFRGLGVDVLRCVGPETAAGCPVLDGRSCPKVARADVILCQLDLDTADHRRIIETYRHHPGFVMVVAPEDLDRWPALVTGVPRIVGPPSRRALEDVAMAINRHDEKEAGDG